MITQDEAAKELWPEFLSVAKVAGILDLSKMTVYRLIHEGQLTANRFGRNLKVPAEELRKYLGVTTFTPEREDTSEQ